MVTLMSPDSVPSLETFTDVLASLYAGIIGPGTVVDWLVTVWHGNDAVLCHAAEYGTAVCSHAANTAYALAALLNMLD